MKRKYIILSLIFLFLLSLFMGCSQSKINLDTYTPKKENGDGGFNYPSNSYEADVVLDGILNEDRWKKEDVISLGSWGDEDVTSGEYGAIINDVTKYSSTKRGIIKMFRGNVGLHFGFEIKDNDICYLAKEDGDSAIWTDNILLNISTKISGSDIPTSNDYYFIITAFGNNCFRRGALAPGMWGAFSGVIDYETKIIFKEDNKTQKGFGIEVVIPYEQIGINKESPIGVTFRSCDRISKNNSMVEREWYYKGGVHHFNTPNDYIIWGEDNNLYNYYDYKMPDVTIKGSVVDYVTKEPLENVDLGNNIKTDNKGYFEIENVNSNEDYILKASSSLLIGDQEYVIKKDRMRGSNGGELNITPTFLTKKNPINANIKGKIKGYKDTKDITVHYNDKESKVDENGNYSIDCTFYKEYETIYITSPLNNVEFECEIKAEDAKNKKIIKDIKLPLMNKLNNTFGKDNKTECVFGWLEEGLFVRIKSLHKTNGYGIAYSKDGKTGNILLYHAFGTMALTDFDNPKWEYVNKEDIGVYGEQYTNSLIEDIYTMVIPYELLNINKGDSIYLVPFEYTIDGPFSWYEDENGSAYQFGNNDFLKNYPILDSNAKYILKEKEKVVSTFKLEPFGTSNANVKFELVEGGKSGIKISIDYTKKQEVFGFGIMIGDDLNNACTDLYAIGYKTIDHKVYGDWNWQGNYVPAKDLGVEVIEEEGKVTLYYSFETLKKYNLNIGKDSTEIKIQMFEYVLDGGGNLYGIYNCINVNNKPLPFDKGLNNFLIWELNKIIKG